MEARMAAIRGVDHAADREALRPISTDPGAAQQAS
jgi:hypothetical protein